MNKSARSIIIALIVVVVLLAVMVAAISIIVLIKLPYINEEPETVGVDTNIMETVAVEEPVVEEPPTEVAIREETSDPMNQYADELPEDEETLISDPVYVAAAAYLEEHSYDFTWGTDFLLKPVSCKIRAISNTYDGNKQVWLTYDNVDVVQYMTFTEQNGDWVYLEHDYPNNTYGSDYPAIYWPDGIPTDSASIYDRMLGRVACRLGWAEIDDDQNTIHVHGDDEVEYILHRDDDIIIG